MEEIWKDVVGFEGLYMVSNFGRIKSVTRIIYNYYNGKRVLRGKIMKNLDLYGYKRIELCKEGKVYPFRVHRLVAMMFIPNQNNYPEVNHIDGNRSNNNVSNLEWCSRVQNVEHSYDNDLNTRNKKVELLKVGDNKEYYFRSLKKACEFLGRTHSYINYCLDSGKDIKGIDDSIYIVKSIKGEQND